MRATSVEPVPVSVETFVRAETDTYFAGLTAGVGIGVLRHRRAPASIDEQDVVRMNRDTLYSSGVFDLDAGPVTISLPDARGRFMSLQVVDEDHYTPEVLYEAGAHVVSRDRVGTRYVTLLVRTLVDPEDPDDVRTVHALQDAITTAQPDRGAFEVPRWDPETLRIVRETLKAVGPALSERGDSFGARGEVDPIRHLVSTATGWGGNPARHARYTGRYPERNDGTTVHRLTVRDVPVDGFWSLSVYNADGFFEKNDENAYSVNDLTARRDDDGSVTIQFGGARGDAPNHLPIMPGWNYVVRLYRPRAEILDGTWAFPEPEPVDAGDAR